MPTPIPAKPSTDASGQPEPERATRARRTQALPIVAALVAVGVATHLLGEPDAPSAGTRSAPVAPDHTAASDTAEAQRAPELDSSPPREADPAVALRALASALPHTERDAQKLKVLEVRALVAQGKIGAARGRAQGYFEQWPGGPDTLELERLTGAHPRR